MTNSTFVPLATPGNVVTLTAACHPVQQQLAGLA